MRYDEKEKRTLVSLYYNGKSVTEICQDHQIPRSTFYSWIQAYRPVESKDSSRTITPKILIPFSAAVESRNKLSRF